MRAIRVPRALVCINTGPYSGEEVLEELRACEGVEEAFQVRGVYDVVAKIQGETIDNLLEIVTKRIKRLYQVQTTLTMMIIEPEKRAQENAVALV